MQKSPKDLERKVMYRKELQNLLSKNQIDNFSFFMELIIFKVSFMLILSRKNTKRMKF